MKWWGGGVAALLVVAGLHASNSNGDPSGATGAGMTTSPLCAPDGPAAERRPPSAVIQTTSGEVKVVSFGRGWDVYQGRRPGQVIAMCPGL